MRRLAATAALIGLLAFPAGASAYPGEARNEQAVFGGPHCHSVGGDATRIAYPSHRAHVAQLTHGPAGAVFAGVPVSAC
jgi:hypothetical protein